MAFDADRGPRVGEMFGRYRLDEKLGAGGVGEVWRAWDTELERSVAIKMLLPRYQDDADANDRFKREARLAAGLTHAHIVKVHSAGKIDKRAYIDMQLIRGDSLAAALGASGPWEPARVLEVLDPVARALDHAHNVDRDKDRRELIHRDVKPGNVLLEARRGQPEHVYLADFGIARAVAPGQSLTGAGLIVGTPAYMAPELWGEERPDHLVDVYALAVMLFEMLTGRLPYPCGTVQAFFQAHVTKAVPLVSALRPGLPRGLDEVVAVGMAKLPHERYRSAGELVRAATAAVRVSGRETVDIPALPGPAATAAAVPPPWVGRPPEPPRVPDGRPARPPETVIARPPAGEQVQPDDPTDPVVEQPQAAPRTPVSWFSGPAHFAGLAATALLIPIALLDLVPLGWALLLPFGLLYALGAVLTLVVAPRR